MPSSVSTHLLTPVILAMGAAALLFAARRGRPRLDPSGATVFKYSIAIRVIAAGCAFALPLAPLLWSPTNAPANAAVKTSPLYVSLMFAALGLPMFWEAERYWLRATPECLHCRSPWRGDLIVPWEHIASIRFSYVNRWFVLESIYGVRIRIPLYLAGINEALAYCERRLPDVDFSPASDGYRILRRPPPV